MIDAHADAANKFWDSEHYDSPEHEMCERWEQAFVDAADKLIDLWGDTKAHIYIAKDRILIEAACRKLLDEIRNTGTTRTADLRRVG